MNVSNAIEIFIQDRKIAKSKEEINKKKKKKKQDQIHYCARMHAYSIKMFFWFFCSLLLRKKKKILNYAS